MEQRKTEDVGVYFEIYQQRSAGGGDTQSSLTGGAWRWRLKGPNDEIIACGESYADHADCLRAVYLVRSTSSHTAIVDI